MATEPQTELLDSLHRLFSTQLYSDLLVICGDEQYRVHRAIVCPRSAFFATACNGNFMERETGIIRLDDDDPLSVQMMIHYFYHLDYPNQEEASPSLISDPEDASSAFCPDPPNSITRKKNKKKKNKELDSTESSNLSLHAMVYALAEKYDIPGLKSVALEKFRKDADIWWKFPCFLRAAEVVYSSTVDQDRSMRDIVVDTFVQHLDLLDTAAVQNTVRSLDLSFDLMMRLRSRSEQAPLPFGSNRYW